jgi:methylglutaconyl-CoA hydratase
MKWIEIKDVNSVYHITLNRPEVRNAFNPEVIQEITHTFQNIPENARVIVMRGKGKIFCSGADLDWMKSMVNFSYSENQSDSLQLYEMFQTILKCSKPIISVVQGAAMGGALGLLACSDVVLAEETSQFCFSEVRLGLAPAVISRFILNKTTLAKSGPWMISGKVFYIPEAMAMGLVHQSAVGAKVEECLELWVQSFLEAAPGAVMDTKKLIHNLASQSESQQRDSSTSLIASRRVSLEGQEGLKSFLEKRQPSWRVTKT